MGEGLSWRGAERRAWGPWGMGGLGRAHLTFGRISSAYLCFQSDEYVEFGLCTNLGYNIIQLFHLMFSQALFTRRWLDL